MEDWVEIGGAHIKLLPEGILIVRWKEGLLLDYEIVSSTIERGYPLTQDRHHWVLVDMRFVAGLTPEGQGYMATGPHRRKMEALAIVVDDEIPVTQVGGPGAPRHDVLPVRTFYEEEEALAFLRRVIERSDVPKPSRAADLRPARFTLDVNPQGVFQLALVGSGAQTLLDTPRRFRVPLGEKVSEDTVFLLSVMLNSLRAPAELRRVRSIDPARQRAVSMALRAASDGELEVRGEGLKLTLSAPVTPSLRVLEVIDGLRQSMPGLSCLVYP